MINLLPQAEKKQLRQEYLLRVAVVALSFLFTLEVLTLFLFVPTYYALYISTSDLNESIAERKVLTPVDNTNTERDLASIKKDLGLLEVASGTVDAPPSSLIEEIISQKSQGIEFSAFAYVRENNPTIQLSGIAATQEDLLAFRRSVQANPRVLDFKYSTSFITQKTKIPFSATVNFK